jgi:osmotically-inducible protein OsmY/sporulation protein YlmC with PRC-barrel domain
VQPESNGCKPMMLLSIGATVRCRDGEAGKLRHVVLEPENGEVTHLVVERGILPRREIVVPASWVETSSDDEIVLNATLEELDMLPDYDELDFIDPELDYKPVGGYRRAETKFWKSPYGGAGSENIWLVRFVRLGFHEEEVLLERGLPVVTKDDQPAGTVNHLIVDPASHLVTHFVVRRGWLWNQKMHILPLEQVLSVSEAGVRLKLTLADLDRAPLYKAPATDDQIAFALQRALETDPRTREAGLRVEVQNGVVRFIGDVTDSVREAARGIAWRIRGVIGFEEDLAVPAYPPLQIGASVHARDGSYGTLHKVVVEPHAHRVTHMVLHKGGLLEADRVVPIERIERIELDGVHLNGDSGELNQYPPYQEEVFIKPLGDWKALEPYPHADTLFWSGPYTGVAPPILPVIEFIVPEGVPENEVVLQRGEDVIYNGELVGSLDHLLFHRWNGTVTHLVVEAYEREHRVFVPTEWIGEIVGNAITLNHWKPDRPGVPIYEGARSDDEILADLQANLREVPALSEVHGKVDRGVVHLSGSVPTPDDKAAAEFIAFSIPGVIIVKNELVIAQEMETRAERSSRGA